MTRDDRHALPSSTVGRALPRTNDSSDRTLALWTAPRRFAGFKRFACRHFRARAESVEAIEALGIDELEQLAELLGIERNELAQTVAVYLGLPFSFRLQEETIDFDLLSHDFCERQTLVPMKGPFGRPRFALANPFRRALAHLFESHRIGAEEADFVIAAPDEVRRILERARTRRAADNAPAVRTVDRLVIDATQPLEPLHRILFLHTLPTSAVS